MTTGFLWGRHLGRLAIVLVAGALTVFLLEGTLQVFHMTVPLEREFYFYPEDAKLSRDYIVERPNLPDSISQNGYPIAAIGDSFTQCEHMWKGVTECYTKMVERLLREQKSDAVVYNYGMSGNSFDQEYRMVKDKILPQKPKLVIWQVYVNDIWENVMYPLYTISDTDELIALSATDNWAYRRQQFYNALPFRDTLRRSVVFRSILKLYEYDIYANTEHMNWEQQFAWSAKKMKLEIADMRRISRETKIPILYVIIPPQSRYLGKEHLPEVHHFMWGENEQAYDMLLTLFSDEPNVIRLDMLGYSQGSADNVLGASTSSAEIGLEYYLADEDMNLLGDKHLNQRGFDIVAKEIVDHIHSLIEGSQ